MTTKIIKITHKQFDALHEAMFSDRYLIQSQSDRRTAKTLETKGLLKESKQRDDVYHLTVKGKTLF